MALGQVGYQEIGWNWVETILTKLSNSLVVKKAFHFDSVLSVGARARGGSVQRGRERFASRCLAWRFLAPGHWESAKWRGRWSGCNSHVWPWRHSTPFPKFPKTICDTTPSLGHGTATIDTFSRGFTRYVADLHEWLLHKPSKSPIPRVIQYTHGLLPWVFTKLFNTFPIFFGMSLTSCCFRLFFFNLRGSWTARACAWPAVVAKASVTRRQGALNKWHPQNHCKPSQKHLGMGGNCLQKRHCFVMFFPKRQVHLCYPRVLNFDQDILPAAGNASRLQREELWTRLLHSDWRVTDAWRQWLPFYLSRWNTHWAIEHNFADWLLLGWFHLIIYIYIVGDYNSPT